MDATTSLTRLAVALMIGLLIGPGAMSANPTGGA